LSHPEDTIELRPFVPADREGVLDLLAQSLGRDQDPRFDALYAWKHEHNVFGPSPCLVAVDGDRLAGVRAFMRWQFSYRGSTHEAVRAVDTATHPDYQGRGIFSRLTLAAIEAVRAQGVSFVFNTPNSQSRPGYLKMGWQIVGRPPISVRPASIASLARIAQSREAAERWSEPTERGRDAPNFVAEHRATIDALLAAPPRPDRVQTVRSSDYLAWRYGVPFLEYRALVDDEGPEAGFVIFRVRRRGQAREVVLDELVVPENDPARRRRLIAHLARSMPGDYIVRVGGAPLTADRFVRLPRQGPILTWRAVCETEMPELGRWDLTMGDIELF
jgi:GNAT superfamily N-acetyltransferase